MALNEKPVAVKDVLLKKALKEVGNSSEGTRKKFTVPFAQKHATEFHEKVYAALMTVPYGRVVSYGELACLAGALRRPGPWICHEGTRCR